MLFDVQVEERDEIRQQTAFTYQLADEDGVRIHTFNYSRTLCRLLEWQKKIIDSCGCYDIRLPIEKKVKGNLSSCHTLPTIVQKATLITFDLRNQLIVLYNGAMELIASFRLSDTRFKNVICLNRIVNQMYLELKKCPHVRYKVFTKFYEYVDFNFDLEAIPEAFPDSGVKISSKADLKNYFKVHIQSLSQEVLVRHKESIYPMAKLLSDAGGMLGLWLGASMVGCINMIMTFQGRLAAARVSEAINVEKKVEDFEKG